MDINWCNESSIDHFLVIFEMKCLSIIRLRAINECTEYKICQICFMRKSMSKMIVISTEQTALCTEWSAPMDWHTRCTLLHWTLTVINSLPFEMHLKHVLWHRNYGILDICGYTKHSERIFHFWFISLFSIEKKNCFGFEIFTFRCTVIFGYNPRKVIKRFNCVLLLIFLRFVLMNCLSIHFTFAVIPYFHHSISKISSFLQFCQLISGDKLFLLPKSL